MNMLINNGILYKAEDVSSVDKILEAIKDANKIGLGKDSIKVTAKPKVTSYDFAGKLDNEYKEFEDITGWEVKMEGDCIDFNEEVLGLSLLEKETDNNTDYNVYTTKEELSDSDYINIICVGKIKGKDKNVIFILKNVFNEDGIKATLKDKDNASVSLTFTAKCTLTDKKPFKILTPKEA